jgi:hypothetical protein
MAQAIESMFRKFPSDQRRALKLRCLNYVNAWQHFRSAWVSLAGIFGLPEYFLARQNGRSRRLGVNKGKSGNVLISTTENVLVLSFECFALILSLEVVVSTSGWFRLRKDLLVRHCVIIGWRKVLSNQKLTPCNDWRAGSSLSCVRFQVRTTIGDILVDISRPCADD